MSIWSWTYTARVILALGPNLAKMFCSRYNFAFGGTNILLPAGYNKYGLLSSNRSLNISIGLSAKSFDFAT